MNLSIITPEKTLFSGTAADVTLPGTTGEFGVLPLHEQVVSTLKAGLITATLENGATEKFAVLGGVTEVKAEGVSVLCEVAKALTGISVEQAQTELAAAKTVVAKAIPDEEAAAAQQLQLAELTLEGVAA
jgi:F-type H+-transporting ATPase subunit epsilon